VGSLFGVGVRAADGVNSAAVGNRAGTGLGVAPVDGHAAAVAAAGKRHEVKGVVAGVVIGEGGAGEHAGVGGAFGAGRGGRDAARQSSVGDGGGAGDGRRAADEMVEHVDADAVAAFFGVSVRSVYRVDAAAVADGAGGGGGA